MSGHHPALTLITKIEAAIVIMAGDLPQESEGTSIKTVLEIRGHPSQLDITYQQTLSDDQVEIGVDLVHGSLHQINIQMNEFC